MSDHLTEEEQLETLKRWWKENGKWVVTAVVLGVGGYFGWGAWQDQQVAKAQAGSTLYTELLDTLGVEESAALSEQNRSEAQRLVEQLKDEHSGSAYGLNAALIRARWAVGEDDLEVAESELRWVLEQRPKKAVEQLARLRLARVLAAQGDLSAALGALDETRPEQSLVADYAEVRGDILVQQGDAGGARSAYESAMEALGEQSQNRAMLLQMKLDDLQQASTNDTPGAEENAS